MDLPSDLIDLLSAFAEERVEYLLVGGQAVALHGVPRFTKADLWLRDTTENLERAKRAKRRREPLPRTYPELLRSARGAFLGFGRRTDAARLCARSSSVSKVASFAAE